MTSSLVGSEMCIRDRPSTWGSSSALTRWEWGGLNPSGSFNLRSVVGPVSYTHLTLPTICSV
eukprot:355491-Prorocentrum_lima.AAC.1